MEDRLAVRDAPRMGGGGGGGGGYGGGVDDSEEEKVYYGFGVFMGLPLADLRAMKEEYLQNQNQPQMITNGPVGGGPPRSGSGRTNTNGVNGNGSGGRALMENGGGGVQMREAPGGRRGGGPPGGQGYGGYDEYEMRDPMGRSHGMVRGGGGDRGHAPPQRMGRDMDPRMMAARGGMMPHPHYQGGGGRMPGGRHGVEYDASVDGIGGPNGGHHHPDDEGDSSDGSYSAPKSHSLNFILH